MDQRWIVVCRGFALAVAMGMAGSAGAAVTQQCQTTEVTFGITGDPELPADACIGWDDAIGASQASEEAFVNGAWSGSFGGGDFDFVAKWSDQSAGSFAGISFTLTAVPQTSGTYSLTWTDNGTNVLPETLDLAFVAKAGQGAGGFLFDDVTLSDTPGSGGGSFTIGFMMPNGSTPGLSHLTFLARLGDEPPPPGVAAPAPLLLLAAPLLLMGWRGRRSR